MLTNKQRYAYYFAWVVALTAMISSLYYSEIRHFAPCVLCWYQRICNYPIVVLGVIGIITQDKNLPKYVLPLSIIGLIISGYHSLLQLGVISEKLAPCEFGVSCLTKDYVARDFFLHYLHITPTIPMLSFIAFLLITISMIYAIKNGAHNGK